jgi:glycosyltransferase involved in cell wall biosynthesis
MPKSPIIVISKEHWASRRRARKQLLFDALLKKDIEKIFYINPHRHVWQPKTVNNLLSPKVDTWQGTFLLPAERYRCIRYLNRLYLYHRLHNRLNGTRYRQIIYYNPWDEPLVRRLGNRLGVPSYFDWTDNWSRYYDIPALQSAQTSAVKNARGVIVVSKRLEQRACRIREGKDRVLFLPNATAWGVNGNRRCPEELMDIPGPRIGFSGHGGPLFDKALLKDLAIARPQWNWVLVGSFDKEMRIDCREINNLHFLGPKPFESLSAYMHHCQVLVAPYKLEIVDGDATKLYDYLTIGHPVISARIETAERLKPFVRIADDLPAWLSELDAALVEKNDAMRSARQEESKKHTWDVRANELLEWLQQQENVK